MEQIQEKIEVIENHVPPEFLIPCKWVVGLKEGTQSELLRVNEINLQNQIECYLRHNAWVEWQVKTKQQDQTNGKR